VHHLIRVIGCRVSHHCNFVAELSGEANGCFDAGMRYKPDDDELEISCFVPTPPSHPLCLASNQTTCAEVLRARPLDSSQGPSGGIVILTGVAAVRAVGFSVTNSSGTNAILIPHPA
jgi:hypothetical protein